MIEALLISTDDPQLPRCLESIKNQTVPFSNLIHINNVCPHHVAYNQGVDKITDEWFMSIAGDMILYPEAVENMIEHIIRYPEIVVHLHHNYDTFIGYRWPGLGVYKTSLVKEIKFRNRLNCDRAIGKALTSNNYLQRRHHGYLATHFDKPDDFQVFRRFYIYGLKFFRDVVAREYAKMKKFYEDTGNPLYQTAMDAMNFAKEKHFYPGSHNIEFDRELYDEFVRSYRQKEINPNLQG